MCLRTHVFILDTAIKSRYDVVMQWFRKNKNPESLENKPEIPPSIPEDTCIYAIGDIHGRSDLLIKIHKLILEDSKSRKSSRKVLIYLGDYIDRGSDSKEVIDILINHPLQGFEKIYIKGNHEYFMMLFLEGHDVGKSWLKWGGEATLHSYGVALRDKNGQRPDYNIMKESFDKNIPEDHKIFLNSLDNYHTEGDYLFIHAGLRPEIPIEEQNINDMVSIREEFFNSTYDFGKTIIFGHTIFDKPFIKKGKIGIDTGAYATGELTALILEEKEQHFINT